MVSSYPPLAICLRFPSWPGVVGESRPQPRYREARSGMLCIGSIRTPRTVFSFTFVEERRFPSRIGSVWNGESVICCILARAAISTFKSDSLSVQTSDALYREDQRRRRSLIPKKGCITAFVSDLLILVFCPRQSRYSGLLCEYLLGAIVSSFSQRWKTKGRKDQSRGRREIISTNFSEHTLSHTFGVMMGI